MKSFLKTLQFITLAALLIGLAFAFIFFRVWQKNERPVVKSATWEMSEIVLGHASKLKVEISAPWHRDIVTPLPLSHPQALAPIEKKGTVTKGALSLTGQRTWLIEIPFVAIEPELEDDSTANFSIKNTPRVSPNSVAVTLPSLTIITPDDLPDSPHVPDQFLTEDLPKEETPPAAEPESFWTILKRWRWAALGLLLIPLFFLVKKGSVIRPIPPWEKALAKLQKLDPDTAPKRFYSALTDILKQYTSERYHVRARTKTTSEFMNILRNHPSIPKGHFDHLQEFARLADEVKFADHVPAPERAPVAVSLVQLFVRETTPRSDESAAQTQEVA